MYNFAVKQKQMRALLFLFYLSIYSLSYSQDFDSSFFFNQLKHHKVNTAYNKYSKEIESLFTSKGLSQGNTKLFWRAMKWNKELQLWAYSQKEDKYINIHTFDICQIVGDLGPKRHQGDFQIPEGVYSIDFLNPNSRYHLSLHVNYPNLSDSVLGGYTNLGGDIYIHGGCETIGCLPMTNEKIEMIYIINMIAMSYNQKSIPIHIFPTKMTVNNINKMKDVYFAGDMNKIIFWENLKLVYDYFENKHQLPSISVNNMNGKYIVNGY